MERSQKTLAVLATIIGSSGGTTAGADAEHRPCKRPSGAAVRHLSHSVVLYERVTADSSAGATHKAWWVCLRSTGRRTHVYSGGLGEAGSRDATHFRTAGRFVAFLSEEANKGVHHYDVRVVDARNGRIGVAAEIAGGEPFALHTLGVTARGVTAWHVTALDGNVVPASQHDVLGVRDARGARVVDTDPAGSIDDVHLRSTRLTWRAGGEPRSAAVSPAA